jgi:hypothetical protein
MKEFTSKDLELINRVSVDMGNPLSRTTAGKVQMAENLMEHQLIKTPEQYIQVITTGRLEPTIEGEQAELMLIRSENEQLSEGKGVMAVVTDAHVLHISEHKVVLASPEARQNADIVAKTTAHIQEHINLLTTMSAKNPALLIALGQTPLPVAPPAAPPMPGGPAAGAPETSAPVLDAEPPLTKAGGGVKMPSMPTDPLTSDKFSPAAAPPA